MTELRLRRAHTADAAALADLGTRSFVEKFGNMYVPADLTAFLAGSHSEDAVAAEIASPAMRICLAERDGALAGFCKLVMRTTWPEYARAEAIELKQLYTEPALTGVGIGARLMDWSIAEARRAGAREMQISVWSGNHGAQRFYARYGFEKVADIAFWVGEQRDEEFLFARLLD